MNKRTTRALLAAAGLMVGGVVATGAIAASYGPGMMYGARTVAQSTTDNGQPGDDWAGYGPGYGMGPGMMGGYGPGYGMGYGMGYGRGYGRGDGYHMGYGRFGRYHGGYGWGPGMMGGYGPGFGMMGGYGMGYGMMGGYGPAFAGILDLSTAQQKKIESIQENFAKKQWGLMQGMHAQMRSLWQQRASEEIDVDATVNAVKSLQATQLQMLRNRLEARKAMRAVLTKEQREKLSELHRWGW